MNNANNTSTLSEMFLDGILVQVGDDVRVDGIGRDGGRRIARVLSFEVEMFGGAFAVVLSAGRRSRVSVLAVRA